MEVVVNTNNAGITNRIKRFTEMLTGREGQVDGNLRLLFGIPTYIYTEIERALMEERRRILMANMQS